MGLDWTNLDGGRGRFAGAVRGFDEAGRDIIEIQLPSRGAFYGEFKPRFADNHNDFDIEIISFGFRDKRNVGLPDVREHFSFEESHVIEQLITALFNNPDARSGVVPFTLKGSDFLGRTYFASDWIVKE